MNAPATKHHRGLGALALGAGLGVALAMWLDAPPDEATVAPPAADQAPTVAPTTLAGGLTMKIQTVPPGANIWLSDQPAGTSPLELSLHPLPGTYPVRAELEGHVSGAADCVVTAADLSSGTALCLLELAAR
jgi:hypothetical protein